MNEQNQNVLRLSDITMQFGGVVAVNSLSLEINKNEIVSLTAVRLMKNPEGRLVPIPGTEKTLPCELLLIAAGFVGFNNTNGFITLENCRSSVIINSSVSGNGTHGGFVARRKGLYTLYIRGCLFDGEFHGSNTTKWGGFVGYRNSGDIYMYHSIFAPSAVEINKAESATFCRNGDNSCCYFRCYYTEDINDGTQPTDNPGTGGNGGTDENPDGIE